MNDDSPRGLYRNSERSKYFDSRPAIDCNDRRRVFDAGFDRGWDSAHGYWQKELARLRADSADLREAILHIASIAHLGGLESISKFDALCDIRRLTLGKKPVDS